LSIIIIISKYCTVMMVIEYCAVLNCTELYCRVLSSIGINTKYCSVMMVIEYCRALLSADEPACDQFVEPLGDRELQHAVIFQPCVRTTLFTCR